MMGQALSKKVLVTVLVFTPPETFAKVEWAIKAYKQATGRLAKRYH